MTLDEVIILSSLGVDLNIQCESKLGPPEGKLLSASIGKGKVSLFNIEGEQSPFVFTPGDWFNKWPIKEGEDG
jgi:hypothetical protein